MSYERGRPLPLFRGAASKIILAHLPLRARRALYEEHAEEAKAVGLGNSWQEFRESLATLRRAGFAIGRGEIDPDRLAIAAPLFYRGAVAGSLAFVLTRKRATEPIIKRLIPLTVASAREIVRAAATRPSPTRA